MCVLQAGNYTAEDAKTGSQQGNFQGRAVHEQQINGSSIGSLTGSSGSRWGALYRLFHHSLLLVCANALVLYIVLVVNCGSSVSLLGCACWVVPAGLCLLGCACWVVPAGLCLLGCACLCACWVMPAGLLLLSCADSVGEVQLA